MARPKRYDQDFVQLIQCGNRNAWTKFYDDMSLLLFHRMRELTGNGEMARDIVAEVFTNFWLIKQNFNAQDDITAYLYVSCRNKAYDYLRSVNIDQRHSSAIAYHLYGAHPGQDPGENMEEVENVKYDILKTIYDKIEELPPRQNQILLMYLKGNNTRQIASQLQISEQTVRNLKSQAVISLKQMSVFKNIGLLLIILYRLFRMLP